MRRIHTLSLLSLILLSASSHAQLYKWVGPDGKVTYSDVAPPSSAKQIETKAVNSGAVATAGLPFELAEAVKNNPVTLYSGTQCAPCDEGRKLLNARGIPFTEKTVTSIEDIARLRQAGGDAQLPLLLVGRNKQKGFETGSWTTALSAAGYPESSKLPKTYRNPAAQAAAPVAKETVASKRGEADIKQVTADDLPPPVGNVPPGFRF